MSLAEAGTTIEEEGVVAVARGFDDTLGGSVGDVVITTDDERVEGVFTIETITTRWRWWGVSVMNRGGLAGEITGGDFAGATDAGFVGFDDFTMDVSDLDIVTSEGGSNKVMIFDGELLGVERVFDADNDVAVVGGNQGSILKPGGIVGTGYFLLNLS